MMVRNMPAKNLSRMHINHGCHIPEPVDEPEIGEVSCPDDIGTNGTQNFEDVGHLRFWSSQIIELHEREASSELRFEAMFAHDA